MKYTFKRLRNINMFVLNLIQTICKHYDTPFERVVDIIYNIIVGWDFNRNGLLRVVNKSYSKEVINDTSKFTIDIGNKTTAYKIYIYYSKNNWKSLYSIQLFDSDHLLMAQFSNENMNNLRYLHELPTLEQEVAYDIYATYCNYYENKKLTDYQHLEMYPKYVEKLFNDSTLLKDIIKHLKQLDNPQIFINYCKTVLTK